MGKFTPKAGFDGKTVDGTVVSSNHNGAILRNRSIPIKKSTTINGSPKTAFRYASSRWGTFTDMQKSAWDAFDFQGNMGYHGYMSFGMNKVVLGQQIPIAPPTLIGALNWTGLFTNSPSASIFLQANRNAFVAPAVVVLYATRPFELGGVVPNENEYRVIGKWDNLSEITEDVTDAYVSLFGDIEGVVNQFVHLKLDSLTKSSAERFTFHSQQLQLTFV